MKTLAEAIAIAQKWEDDKFTGSAALVGRALLAHINSLASPQVTDEQILHAMAEVRLPFFPDTNRIDSEQQVIRFVRVLLSATSAEAPVCPHCGTHEVELSRTCHNSACSGYANTETVFEGWHMSTEFQLQKMTNP